MAVDLDDMFRRAKAAVDSGNYDYAKELFREILRTDPDHVRARMALRGCCRKWFDEKGGSAKVVGVIKGAIPYVRALIALSRPNKCIEACEDYLNGDPYNVHVLMKLGRGARKAGHLQLAVFVFEDVRNRHPGHIPALRQLAEIHEEDLPEVKKALGYYAEIQRLMPTDGHVEKKLKDLNARMHMEVTQLEKQESFFDGVRDKDKQKELQEKDRGETIMRSEDQIDAEIRKIQATLKNEPESIPHLKRLGVLFLQKKDPKKALLAYEKVLEVQPDEFEAKSKIGDIKFRHGEQNLQALEQKLAANPEDESLKAKAAAGRKQLTRFRLEQCAWRCQAHPTDLQLKAAYGDALLPTNEIDKAIEQYQKALEDVRIRTRVRNALGQCFMIKEQFDLAVSQFEGALERAVSMNDEAKDIHYSLGLCAEKMDTIDTALEHYKTIYEVDIGFRDVSAKIDELSKRKRQQAET